MKRSTPYIFLLLLLGLMLVPAQAASAQDAPPLRHDLPYGVGFQSMVPAFGISGMYDFTPQVSGQAILGFFGGVQTYAGRALYRFDQQEAYDLFGFGGVGAWT